MSFGDVLTTYAPLGRGQMTGYSASYRTGMESLNKVISSIKNARNKARKFGQWFYDSLCGPPSAQKEFERLIHDAEIGSRAFGNTIVIVERNIAAVEKSHGYQCSRHVSGVKRVADSKKSANDLDAKLLMLESERQKFTREELGNIDYSRLEMEHQQNTLDKNLSEHGVNVGSTYEDVSSAFLTWYMNDMLVLKKVYESSRVGRAVLDDAITYLRTTVPAFASLELLGNELQRVKDVIQAIEGSGDKIRSAGKNALGVSDLERGTIPKPGTS